MKDFNDITNDEARILTAKRKMLEMTHVIIGVMKAARYELPDDPKEIKRECKKGYRMLAQALDSHATCIARLQLAEMEIEALKSELEPLKTSNLMKKQINEKEDS
jgi:hypothetical protein